MPVEHAAYLAKPDYIANTKKDLSPITAPRHDDPLSWHRLSYLSGDGGSGKTRRAIKLFLQRNPVVFTPTHRLAKEMQARGVQAQTYHSSGWSGGAMVLGKLPVSGRPTNLITIGQRPIALAVGVGVVWTF